MGDERLLSERVTKFADHADEFGVVEVSESSAREWAAEVAALEEDGSVREVEHDLNIRRGRTSCGALGIATRMGGTYAI